VAALGLALEGGAQVRHGGVKALKRLKR
jgi:hypothetical protein